MVGRTKTTTIGCEQLEDGIQLLLAGRYISALSLLGAAEEVFARLCEEKFGAHPIDDWWKQFNDANRDRGYQDLPKQRFYRALNAPRNSVKHYTPGDVTSVALYKQPAAVMMARRAVLAADALGVKFRGREDLSAWYVNNGYSDIDSALNDKAS